jgi:transposase
MSQLTDFERGRIIGRWEAGESTRDIAGALNHSQSQVTRAIKAFKEEHQTTIASRSGRPSALNDRDVRQVKRITKKNRNKPIEQITDSVNESLSTSICSATVRNYLHEEGYYSRVALRKPFVSGKNRQKRLKWCKERKNWNIEWNYIIWSDESRYTLHQSDGRQRVWRLPKEKYDVDCLVPTFKHGGGGVMVWGCFVNNCLGPLVVIDGKINGKGYQELLRDNLLPFLDGLGDGSFTFQDDNAPVHTAGVVIQWKEANLISSLPWPAQSPDLNPIEHVWDQLEKAIRKRNPPKNTNELVSFLMEEWANLDRHYLQKLVDSMPRRVQAVIDSKGNPTKY